MYRIAHISDLHISEFDTENLTNIEWLAKILGSRLKIDVVADKHNDEKLKALEVEFGKLKPKLIVVTGDITNFGDQRSFDRAVEILTRLKEVAEAERIICIPGNHDSLCERVAELRSRGRAQRFLIWLGSKFNKVLEVSAAEAKKMNDSQELTLLGNFQKFLRGRYDEVNPSKPVFVGTSWGEVAFFLFNSTNDKGVMANVGRIGAVQYNLLNQALSDHHRKARIASAVRIALLHHHPIPVPAVDYTAVDRGYDWMEDGTRFSEYVGKELGKDLNFHFILHGHQHVPYVFANAPGLNAHIVAAGSASSGDVSRPSSFNVVELLTPFEARVRRFDYQPTGYVENAAKAQAELPIRALNTVRLSAPGDPETGEDLALRGTVRGRKEAYDEDHQYDVLDYRITVTGNHEYLATYRHIGKVVGRSPDKGIVFALSGNPPRSFGQIAVTAKGKSSRQPNEIPLRTTLIDDRKSEIVFRVEHAQELAHGDTFDLSMTFKWQSSAEFPVECDGINLMYFAHPVGRLNYRVSLPWNPLNRKVIAFGIKEETDLDFAADTVTSETDGTFEYAFELQKPRPLAYLILFKPH